MYQNLCNYFENFQIMFYLFSLILCQQLRSVVAIHIIILNIEKSLSPKYKGTNFYLNFKNNEIRFCLLILIPGFSKDSSFSIKNYKNFNFCTRARYIILSLK